MAKKKVRVDLRKNRTKPPRDRAWTRGFEEHGYVEDATKTDERIRAKGDMSRKRTIMQEDDSVKVEPGAGTEMPAVDEAVCMPGRVLRVYGLYSIVEANDGRFFRCAVRRVLRSLSTEQRNIVTTGDRVWIRRAMDPVTDDPGVTSVADGVIERVEPRHGVLSRTSRGRGHTLVANVDQVVFVLSLVEPELKPHLIDRYLASAAKGNIRPILCLNKSDLIEPALYQPLIGRYCQLGVTTFLTSATSGLGIAELRSRLRDQQTVIAGQSGVGKSSLLNAIQPGLGLRVREVSDVNHKGKHTTTTAELIKLDSGGWVADTPGVRQFELWDIQPEEVEGYFVEFRPFVALVPFPTARTFTRSAAAVKRAVERRQISALRYHSYLGMFTSDQS